MRLKTRAILPIALVLLMPVAARSENNPKAPPIPRAGIGLAGGTALPDGLRSAKPETPCWVLLTARRADLDDPAALLALLDEARSHGLKTLVRLEETDPQPGTTTWTDRLLPFAQALGDRVDGYQVLAAEMKGMAPRDYAFLLKNARVSIRAGGSNAAIVSPPLDLFDDDWIFQLFAEDAAPYLDVIAATDVEVLERVAAIRDRRHPRAAVWVTDSPLPEDNPAPVAIAAYLESLSEGAEVVIFAPSPLPAAPEPGTVPGPESSTAPPAHDSTLPPGPATTPEASPAGGVPGAEPAAPATPAPAALVAPSLGEVLAYVRSLFPPGLRPAAKGVLPFNPATAVAGGAAAGGNDANGGANGDAANGAANGDSGKVAAGQGSGGTGAPSGQGPSRVDLKVLPFFDEQSLDGLVAFRATGDQPPPGARIPLRTPVEFLELITPERMQTRRLSEAAGPGATLVLPLRPTYRLLRYRLAVEAIPVKEQARASGTAELTAEEVIAFERERRGVQDARLDHYEAKAIISIHYRLAAINETLDLSSENRLFVHDDKQDYQQLSLFVNGAVWRGKEPPHLPYLQPEQVGEVPLDISLDERYRYALEGRSTIDGRDCYVLSFEPVDPSQSLYKGKAYIDSKEFVRLRMEAVQTALKDPLRSSEVVYKYGPVESEAGTLWLPVDIDGQMTYELLGYTLAIEREIEYSEFDINKPGIEERVKAAFESGQPLLRDTESGLKRVVVVDGQEQLESLDKPKNTLLVFGISAGEAGSLSFPFAGVNFFDFNFKNTGTQFNLALAGPFADISWNQPNLFHTSGATRPISLALQGSFTAIEVEDKLATSAGTTEEDRVDVLEQEVRATLGIPLGDFLRWSVQGRALYQNYDRQKKTSPDFVLPPTNIEGVFHTRMEYSRRGYQVSPWAEWGTRSDWGPWGRCTDVSLEACEVPGSRFSEDDRDFTRLGIDLRKSYYIGIFHKISLGLSGFDGRSLDRYSRFELGDFRSARVRGFNASGIHFDRGLVGEVSYAFGVTKIARAEIGVQEGIIQSEDDFGPGYERAVGTGLNVEFSGPWSTFVNVRVGYALDTTIPDKGGGGDLRVVFFKTWDKWSRHGGTGTPPSAPPPAPGPGPAPPDRGSLGVGPMPPDLVPIDPSR
ncbi:MAG TPA: hypothetical protein VFQ07_09165 [Candidatus Polarisedimenticolia bacterium]|nr:hypothetical protein [Candidatus Polarisedimenticolia bacterium]